MELLGLIGVAVLLTVIVVPWVALANARRAQAQLTVVMDQLDRQGRRLEQALRQIDALRTQAGAAAPKSATEAAVTPVAPQPAPAAASVEQPAIPTATAAPPVVPLPPARGEPTPPQPTVARPAGVPQVARPKATAVQSPAAAAKTDSPKPYAQPVPRPAATAQAGARATAAPTPPQLSEFEQRLAGWIKAAREWLFGGNLVAKVGLLILFIGVAFLVRLATNYISVPIEVRLAGVAAGAIALLLWGWRIRESRRGIALPVQGAALAILMLVTFGGFKLFGVIPAGAAFALLFVLVAFTCALAVMQDALWLAVFGISGGFAAPILTSTGSGSHVALFSYYCLLNAGVLAIALKRSWRMLNVLGFAFTFIVGAAWGVQRYVPENYASAQPFLVIFWLFYIALAVLYGWRRAPLLKSYVDGTLVFGVPTAAMALQYGLVKDIPFGMALSALVIALTYASVASVLWRWRRGSLRLLVESFLALAVVFGTLAIPLAFDGRWTSAVWAVEGAAIVWIGLKQKQVLAWRFGIAVQLASWVAFVSAMTGLDPVAALAGNVGLGFLLLGVAGVLMALMFRQQADPTLDAEDRARQRFGQLASGFIAAAAVWLLLGLWVEAWLRLDGAQRATALVATALLLVIGLQQLAKRAAWRLPSRLGAAIGVLAGVVFARLMLVQMDWRNREPDPQARFSDLLSDGPLFGGLLLCAGALVSALAFKRRALDAGEEPEASRWVRTWLLLAVFWWCGFALHGLAHGLAYLTGAGANWYGISFWAGYGIGLVLSALAWMLFAVSKRLLEPRWAMRVFWPALTGVGALVFAVQIRGMVGWWTGRAAPVGPELGPVMTLPLPVTTVSDAFLALLAGPLFGAMILCAITGYAARRMGRGTLPYAATPEDGAQGTTRWLVAFGLSWYLLLIDGWAQFLARMLAVLQPGEAQWALNYPQAGLVLVAASGALFIALASRNAWAAVRWLAAPLMVLQAIASVSVLARLYLQGQLPSVATGIALVACWGAMAWCLRRWSREQWLLSYRGLQLLHFGRVIAPWLMLMPVISLLLAGWLRDPQTPAPGGSEWLLAGQWPDYVASWVGIMTLLLLLRQANNSGWPLRPMRVWYERSLIPIAMLWGVLLVIYWNLRQDGSMAPLPYVPLLNPLDITTGFVALLVAMVWRANAAVITPELHATAVKLSMALAFGWFNLMLLRSAAQYLPLPYRFDALYASQFVQAMLSIVWALSAFFLMRFAVRRLSKPLWTVGAALLGVVVAKLFLVDLSNVGSVARIVSFLGVGGLMLLIGYIAPLPRTITHTDAPATERA